jgi:ABC-type transporter Mla MlaB component
MVNTDYSTLDRESTIKKINDIEAHMAQNWLGRKLSKTPQSTHNQAKPAPYQSPAVVSKTAYLGTVQGELLSTDDLNFDFTKELAAKPVTLAQSAATTAPVPAPASKPFFKIPPKAPEAIMGQSVSAAPPKRPVAASSDFEHGISEFSNSKLVSYEMGDILGDSDLQDAAIRFAEGDNASAEAILQEALNKPDQSFATAEMCAAALFDLYRSTNNRPTFEAAALDFAQRFGKSPPEWYVCVTPVVAAAPSTLGPSSTLSGERVGDWVCPADLDLPAVQVLQALKTKSGKTLVVDWNRLSALTLEAAQTLNLVFLKWINSNIELRFDGSDVLLGVLDRQTPRGDPRVDQLWWRLRMDALRVLGSQEAFEEVAMEFCLNYEISPPSWEPAKCRMTLGEDTQPSFEATCPAPLDSTLGESGFSGAVIELTGEVLGEDSPQIAALQNTVAITDNLPVSCAMLVRIDFAAAGAVLNWVTACEALGCRVQFVDVPRLVATFFNVMGISEYARISLRSK